LRVCGLDFVGGPGFTDRLTGFLLPVMLLAISQRSFRAFRTTFLSLDDWLTIIH